LNSGLHAVKQVLYCLNHTSSPFCSDYFAYGVSQTTCPCWLQTMVLISASQVAGITGLSHQLQASVLCFFVIYLCRYLSYLLLGSKFLQGRPFSCYCHFFQSTIEHNLLYRADFLHVSFVDNANKCFRVSSSCQC
jgi:hypothetical protein